MTEDFKTRWANALRSGKYSQGKFYLRGTVKGEYKYCCLGVALMLVDTNLPIDSAQFTCDVSEEPILDLTTDQEKAFGYLNDGFVIRDQYGNSLTKESHCIIDVFGEEVLNYIEKNAENPFEVTRLSFEDIAHLIENYDMRKL